MLGLLPQISLLAHFGKVGAWFQTPLAKFHIMKNAQFCALSTQVPRACSRDWPRGCRNAQKSVHCKIFRLKSDQGFTQRRSKRFFIFSCTRLPSACSAFSLGMLAGTLTPSTTPSPPNPSREAEAPEQGRRILYNLLWGLGGVCFNCEPYLSPLQCQAEWRYSVGCRSCAPSPGKGPGQGGA